jgi:hypothetical protein
MRLGDDEYSYPLGHITCISLDHIMQDGLRSNITYVLLSRYTSRCSGTHIDGPKAEYIRQ